ncbi:NAD(P)/FAD-dependent oxidoreductase [Primorskyibacter sp. 2E107]|uniref:NAD(P)/FAD-dependent oxidoreductase n=1 Tax=Primorskyibacter sp. 2E107 TaxID=3403458 RepID=UPI003AF92CF0
MKRLFEAAAYEPQPGNYWATTRPATDWPPLAGPVQTDVAIIGGGFTGLNAALSLAQNGVLAHVFEADRPGFGASGRNGGFCCLGGSKLTDSVLARRHGRADADLWSQAESAAIDHVARLLQTHEIDADTHSDGEICLAHTARAARRMAGQPGFLTLKELQARGLDGPWHGGLHTPKGFALNPQKYHDGLAKAAQSAGATLHARSPVTALRPTAKGWQLDTPHGIVTAARVILATNGYSSDDLPDWLRARTMPVQSSVIVTRPITPNEQQAAGYTATQMAYDSRTLLHYFRLMPNGRFLFGMRGGLRATPGEQATISRKIRQDFHAMFPAWRDVDITHEWSGLVCLLSGLVPFVGAVPDHPGLFAAMGYHGNGVAMGSYSGHLIANRLLKREPGTPAPNFLSQPPRRFPLGMRRRLLLAPAYWMAERLDM